MNLARSALRGAAAVALLAAAAVPSASAAPAPVPGDVAQVRAFAAATHLPYAAAREYVALTAPVGDLQARGVAEYAATFAGVWRTPADGGLVHMAFTRDAAVSAARLTARFARRDLVRVTTARTSLRSLDALSGRVAAELGRTPATVSVDVANGAVRVETPGADAVRTLLAARLPGAPVVVGAGRATTPLACTGRVCPGSASGGLDLLGTGTGGDLFLCTSGFDATTVATGAATLVTAGHCFNSGGLATNNGIPIGQVTTRVWPGGDAEAIAQLPVYLPTNDVVWTTAGAHVAVARVVGRGVTEAVGAAVCRTGITTENQCGTIQSLNVSVTYVTGQTVTGLTKASNCSQPGDSGGPFMSGTDAYGITSGGTVGACGSGTYSLYYPANRIESALGVRINT
ncbi:MAG: streptogrisin [Frankiaceae bacterium]|jgi:streptogrisin C|nr:streptogrisin [Frankiaceae bacterium]